MTLSFMVHCRSHFTLHLYDFIQHILIHHFYTSLAAKWRSLLKGLQRLGAFQQTISIYHIYSHVFQLSKTNKSLVVDQGGGAGLDDGKVDVGFLKTKL